MSRLRKKKLVFIAAVLCLIVSTNPISGLAYTVDTNENKVIYRTIVNLRLRDEPTVQGNILRTVPQGTLVQRLCSHETQWFRVYVNGLNGYMDSEFLEFVMINDPSLPIYAAGFVSVMDVQTGWILYENNQHTRRYPASITKIMTALLVLEQADDLSEPIVFSSHAVDIPSYASNMGMSVGDTLTVYEALYGLMLTSGNEVARASAEHISGSVDAFVMQMNRRAAELGAINTRFVNPCGLPGPYQYTTAYDMALIMREAIQNPVFSRIIATPVTYVPPTASNPEPRSISNTHRMIQDGPEFNQWVNGGKTGFTNAAQHTLVTYAEQNGHSVIVSVLYSPSRSAVFSDTESLLNFAFSQYEDVFIFDSIQTEPIPIYQTLNERSVLVGDAYLEGGGLWVSLPKDFDQSTLRYEIQVPQTLHSPIYPGDVVGVKTIYSSISQIGEIELRVAEIHMLANEQTSFQRPIILIAVALILIALYFVLRKKKHKKAARYAFADGKRHPRA